MKMKLILLPLAGLLLAACSGPQKATQGIKNNDVPAIPSMEVKAVVADTVVPADTIGVDQEPIVDTTSSIFIKSNDESRARKFVDEGTREGVWETYYSNGKVAAKANYAGGILEGIFETFYPNGNYKEKLAYIHGLREGVSEAYYENGNVSPRAPASTTSCTATGKPTTKTASSKVASSLTKAIPTASTRSIIPTVS